MLRTACRFLPVWFLLAVSAEAATSQARPGAHPASQNLASRGGRQLLLASLHNMARAVPFTNFAHYYDSSAIRKSMTLPPKAAPPEPRKPVLKKVPRRKTLKTKRPPRPATRRYDGLIRKHALDQGLDPKLVKAVIAAESSFRRKIRSSAGAVGLMQLMPLTAEEMGVPRSRLNDASKNIEAGTRYLAHLFKRIFRRYGLAGKSYLEAPHWMIGRVLAAYNAGPRFLYRTKRYKATRRYVAKVLKNYGSALSDLSPANRLIRPTLAVMPLRRPEKRRISPSSHREEPHTMRRDHVKYGEAGVAELADALDSKSSGSDTVWVRVPPPAHFLRKFGTKVEFIREAHFSGPFQ